MKNIIIAGPSRAGKTSLAKKINEELNYFVISLDKLMTAFGRAYPQLDIRIGWNYEKATANITPFLGHYLGMLSSGRGFADDLNLRKHAVKGNRFVLEGGHFDFEKISSIMKTYGIEEMKDNFILIGLAQNKKTAEEFFNDLRKYDTEDDWTYGFDDSELREFSEMSVRDNREIADYLPRYGFTVYDTSVEREKVFDKIVSDIKTEVFSMIPDSLEPRQVFRFFEIISRIPRGSGNEEQIARYLEDFALERGLWVLRDGGNNVVIKKPGTAGFENAPAVIIQGHSDMVCEKNKDTEHDFEKDPIELIAEGDFIRANGTTLGADNGVAVAMALALLDSGSIPHPPLEVVLTAGEEIGLLGAAALDCSVLSGKILINLDSDVEGVFFTSCAGGLRADMGLPVEPEPAKPGAKAFLLRVKGLKGGHSGMEIDKNRANAVVLLGRALNALIRGFDISVASVSGGMKINAIPREAEALIYAASEEAGGLADRVRDFEKLAKAEFAAADPDISIFLAEAVPADGVPPEVYGKAARDRLISALLLTPNGVQSVSAEVSGLVKTSNNIGIVGQSGGFLRICSEARSSSASEKNLVREKIDELAGLLGAETEYSGEYPGWEHNPDSPLRKKLSRLYEKMYGAAPKETAVHAGLECGFFAERIPGLDMISLGPDVFDIHTPDERLSVSSTARVWDFLVKALEII